MERDRARRVTCATGLSLAVLWAASHAPGLCGAWWYYDDWALLLEPSPFTRGLQNGRPIEGLTLASYRLEGHGLDASWNIALRALQGALHVATAWLAARMLGRRLGLVVGALAVLPFLLWPFGAEATLWRATLTYPLAALASVLAVRLSDGTARLSLRRAILACGVAAAAMLTQQSGACVGLALFAVLLLADVLRGDAVAPRLRRAVPLLAGYLAGGAVSYAIIRTLPEYGRGALTDDPLAKLGFLLELEKDFLTSSRAYPRALRILHVATVLAAFATLAWWMRDRTARRLAAPALACVAATAVLPYLAVLVVESSWGPWRVMYGAPLLLAACFVVLWRCAAAAWMRRAALAVHLAVIVCYAAIAWRNAGDYAHVFREDLALAARIRDFARQNGAASVCAPSFPDVVVHEWNPYGVRYLFGDSKVPALFRSWSGEAYLQLLTGLPLERSPDAITRCREISAARACTGRFVLTMLPGSRTLCVLLP